MTLEEKHRTFTYDPAAIAKWVVGLEGPVKVVYESGFCGFSLYRSLVELQIDCHIAAISKTARPKGDKVKTDRKDARFLAHQLASNNLSIVVVPDIETEGLRDLSRRRTKLRDDLTAAKHRVSQMTMRYGFRFDGKEKNWSVRHRHWLGTLEMPTMCAQLVFDACLEDVERIEEEKARCERLIHELCRTEPIACAVKVYSLIKGVSEITAFCVLVEIGDVTRFKTAGAFCGFLGLVPSEESSGDKTSRGRITKTGNAHVRKALVEAAWGQNRAKSSYVKIPEDIDPEIARAIRSINTRLKKRRERLLTVNRRRPCVANTAIARELACSFWALGRLMAA